MGRDVAHAPPHAAHPQDADCQLVELPPTNRVADVLEFLRGINLVAEEFPGAEELKEISKDKIADGEGIGIGRVNNLNAPPATFGYVDIFQPDAAPSDDFQPGSAIEKRGIYFRISPHDQPLGL